MVSIGTIELFAWPLADGRRHASVDQYRLDDCQWKLARWARAFGAGRNRIG